MECRGGYNDHDIRFMLLVGFGRGTGMHRPAPNEVFPTSVRAAALGIIYNRREASSSWRR